MPSYFYHLKFELYRDPPAGSRIDSNSRASRDSQVWSPAKDSNIFDNLPSQTPDHSASSSNSPQASQTQPWEIATTSLPIARNSVIDCGALRPVEFHEDRGIAIPSEALQRRRTSSFPLPQPSAAINPRTAVRDWRFGRISVASIDFDDYITDDTMPETPVTTSAAATVGPSMGTTGKAAKGTYIQLMVAKDTNLGWGIVHLYREGKETSDLHLATQEVLQAEKSQAQPDYTTVCIPAVPSYLSPSDFLGFIGDKWREHVSHYRMVMTGRMNRYMVLMKFRDSKQARIFGREFDGKVFNLVEPETCNVAFIRSITFDTPTAPSSSYPGLDHDPFTPSGVSDYSSLKPFPPPTPDLIELPTCPVCLERMDDTTGLLTILCQHVFHCSCLQKWKGSGCPVCRHSNTSSSFSSLHISSNPAPTMPYNSERQSMQPFGSNISNLCAVCDCPEDLWICLICGHVGCGRYKGGHAKEHWKNTAHTFSLELSTQHVWDYAGDMWVHRLIRDKGDGKLVDLPRHQEMQDRSQSEDVVPKAKLESIGMEYTHLLTSQLESQRLYFEEMLSKAVDKASKASAAAEKATAQASDAQRELQEVKAEQHKIRNEIIPSLEKDLGRERARATKSTELARNLSKSLQEEKKVSEGLMKRIEHINKEVTSLNEQAQALKLENADLKDQNHDLSMFISGQEKLKELEAEGTLEDGEIQAGSVTVPEEKKRRKGKERLNK
ncbi:Zn-finger in ubiquitin-hydrolase [Xylaria nigripes]|nr:Zn-finger in ubiquitin-hydrolase [Xylaria nigripes]